MRRSQPGKGLSNVQRLSCVTMYINNHMQDGKQYRSGSAEAKSKMAIRGDPLLRGFGRVAAFGATWRGQGSGGCIPCSALLWQWWWYLGFSHEVGSCLQGETHDSKEPFLGRGALNQDPLAWNPSSAVKRAVWPEKNYLTSLEFSYFSRKSEWW